MDGEKKEWIKRTMKMLRYSIDSGMVGSLSNKAQYYQQHPPETNYISVGVSQDLQRQTR